MSEPHPGVDDFVDELDAAEDDGEEEGGLVIVEERNGPAARRWVRYAMPVMVEVDRDEDKVTRVVTLPEEIREDRDDMGHFLVYDEQFIRRHDGEQPQTHAFSVAQPEWLYDHLRAGPPRNWPKPEEWEEGFDLTEADDAYAEVHALRRPEVGDCRFRPYLVCSCTTGTEVPQVGRRCPRREERRPPPGRKRCTEPLREATG